MKPTTQALRIAFLAGKQAAHIGFDATQSHYDEGTLLHAEWLVGFFSVEGSQYTKRLHDTTN